VATVTHKLNHKRLKSLLQRLGQVHLAYHQTVEEALNKVRLKRDPPVILKLGMKMKTKAVEILKAKALLLRMMLKITRTLMAVGHMITARKWTSRVMVEQGTK
jgi:hypothetical protein